MPSRNPQQQPNSLIPLERVERRIYLIRGQRVMLSSDLAELYGVAAKQLNQAVSRNSERFPADFMFRLSKEEFDHLRSQIVTSSWGGQRYPPYAFTEEGVAMLSAVLRSTTAVQVSIQIMRAFVRLRQLLASNDQLRRKLDDLERKLDDHNQKFTAVFAALRQLMSEPEPPARPRIGFHTQHPSPTRTGLRR